MNQTEAEQHASNIITEALKEEFIDQLMKSTPGKQIDVDSIRSICNRLKPRIAQLILDRDRLDSFHKNRYDSLLQDIKRVVDRHKE